MQYQGIQILQVIIALLDHKGLIYFFISDEEAWEDHTLHFYERNPTRRGLDFSETHEARHDFLSYAVELHCINPGKSQIKPFGQQAASTSGSREPQNASRTSFGIFTLELAE
jgi:hypothetical protein